CRQADTPIFLLGASRSLGQLREAQGALHEAARLYHAALEHVREAGPPIRPPGDREPRDRDLGAAAPGPGSDEPGLAPAGTVSGNDGAAGPAWQRPHGAGAPGAALLAGPAPATGRRRPGTGVGAGGAGRI